MSLDVDVPAPPDVAPDPPEADDEYRRAELQRHLEDGAWREGFEAWAADTDVDETAVEVARDLDLFAQFDFFWDDFVGRVGFHAPGVPENWSERDLHPDIDSWAVASGINAEMASLGESVSRVLTDEYVDWEGSDAPGEDLPDFDA